MELVRITAADAAGQAAFVRYVPLVFPGADFARWREAGEWTDAYVAYALIDGGDVQANASVTRMRVIVDGAEFVAHQFGAVGTLPTARGRGLATRVLQAALDAIGDAPSFLFANAGVVDFYPRFGFTPLPQVAHAMPWRTARSEPSRAATTLDPRAPSTLERIRALAPRALPVSKRFGARDYGRIVSWYLCTTNPPRVDVIGDALVFSERDGTTLRLLDVLAPRRVDLDVILSALVDEPTDRIAFGFEPDVFGLSRCAFAEDAHAHCFIRNFPTPPRADTQFPLLART